MGAAAMVRHFFSTLSLEPELPPSHVAPPIRVATFYRFTHFDDCAAIQRFLKIVCDRNRVRGTLIVAAEGINGTIAGEHDMIGEVIRQIETLPGCSDLTVKDSQAAEMPFDRMKVKVKKEIVTMGVADVSPLRDVGQYVSAVDWNALVSDPDTVVIDTRNSYEVTAGTFRNAINPDTDSFREFPSWFREHRASLTGAKSPKIAMFCTGGIRCEKATAFLKAEGLEDVFHLEGGILKYLEEIPAEQSLWEGECFVFDQRICLTHGLEAGTSDLCSACQSPVSTANKESPYYQEGVSCPACYGSSDSKSAQLIN